MKMKPKKLSIIISLCLLIVLSSSLNLCHNVSDIIYIKKNIHKFKIQYKQGKTDFFICDRESILKFCQVCYTNNVREEDALNVYNNILKNDEIKKQRKIIKKNKIEIQKFI